MRWLGIRRVIRGKGAKTAVLNWFNHKRLLGPIGNITPAQAEAACYRQRVALPIAA
jgi:transposase InsO family protein